MDYNVVLAGYGEIGKALHYLITRNGMEEIKIQIHDPGEGYRVTNNKETDILLICFPYSDQFVETVKEYQTDFNPKATIVFSSVAIGTCKKLENTVHSPVEGRHDRMVEYLHNHPRWVGGTNSFALSFLKKVFYHIHPVKEARFTEALKLLSTTVYGINIEWARYCGLLAEEMGMDKKLLRQYTYDYNDLNRKMGVPEYQRYNLIPPDKDEVIGGHCVLPNAAILFLQAHHPFIYWMLMINNVLENRGLPEEDFLKRLHKQEEGFYDIFDKTV